MTPEQESVVGRVFLVIAVMFSALFISTWISRKVAEFLPVDRNKLLKELKTLQGQAKNMGISIGMYLIGVFVAFMFAGFVIFGYFTIAEETTLDVTFARAMASFKDKFWLQGQMMFAYTPLIVSTILVFTLFMILFASNSDALQNLKFSTLDTVRKSKDGDDSNSGSNDPTFELEPEETIGTRIPSDIELFQRHVLLMIFLSAMFVYMVIFSQMWSTSKALFASYTALLCGIIVSTIATFYKRWFAVALYGLVTIGYMKSRMV